MFKIRSHSGAAKRIKRTANGLKHKQSHANHILTKKSAKRKRHLRAMSQIAQSDKALIVRMLPCI